VTQELVRYPATIEAENIRKGDRFVAEGFRHWTAREDALVDGGLAIVEVEYDSGALGSRAWELGTITEVERTRRAR